MKRFGTKEFQNLFKTMRENGDIHPDSLTKPALRNDAQPYYEAYRSLSASRTWSQVGPNPITQTEINCYFENVGITDYEERKIYLRLIQGLDAVEVEIIRASIKK